MITVYRQLEELKSLPETCIALGYFDGIHAGHEALIRKAVEEAKKRGMHAAVCTFFDSPKKALGIREEGFALMTWQEKVNALEAMNVDYLIAPTFKDIRSMSPESFVNDFLVAKCNMQCAFCGFNYSFGYMAKGTPELLKALGEMRDETKGDGIRFSTYIQPPFTVDGEVVSSTLIRKLVSEGEVEKANRLLGHRFSLEGETVKGRGIGKTIGFPTANLIPDRELLLPEDGVYVTCCRVKDAVYMAVTNVGTNPTVNSDGRTEKRVETHILQPFAGEKTAWDGKSDLYGSHFRVWFCKRLRGEVKFANADELKEQIGRDKQASMDYWNTQSRKEFVYDLQRL